MTFSSKPIDANTLARFMYNLREQRNFWLTVRTIKEGYGDTDNEMVYSLHDDDTQYFTARKPTRTPETARWYMPLTGETIIDFKNVPVGLKLTLDYTDGDVVGFTIGDKTCYIMDVAPKIKLEDYL